MIKIKITAAKSPGYWYAPQIGAKLYASEVKEDGSAFVDFVGGGGGYVAPEDFKVLEAENELINDDMTLQELAEAIRIYTKRYKESCLKVAPNNELTDKEKAVLAAKHHKLFNDPVYRHVGNYHTYAKPVRLKDNGIFDLLNTACAAGTIGCTGMEIQTHKYPKFLNGASHNRCASCLQFIPTIKEMCLAGTLDCKGYLIAQREPYGTQFKPVCNQCGKSPANLLPPAQEKCIGGTTGCPGAKTADLKDLPEKLLGKEIQLRCAVCGGVNYCQTHK